MDKYIKTRKEGGKNGSRLTDDILPQQPNEKIQLCTQCCYNTLLSTHTASSVGAGMHPGVDIKAGSAYDTKAFMQPGAKFADKNH